MKLAIKAGISGKVSIDEALVRETLRVSPRPQVVTVEDVQRAVCEHYRIKMGQLTGKDRHREVALPAGRHVARAGPPRDLVPPDRRALQRQGPHDGDLRRAKGRQACLGRSPRSPRPWSSFREEARVLPHPRAPAPETGIDTPAHRAKGSARACGGPCGNPLWINPGAQPVDGPGGSLDPGLVPRRPQPPSPAASPARLMEFQRVESDSTVSTGSMYDHQEFEFISAFLQTEKKTRDPGPARRGPLPGDAISQQKVSA